MSKSPKISGQEPLYETISRVLRHNIKSGRLPEGLVLIEGPIAKLMQTSRAPVQTSLRMLNSEGLIHRFRGRGYLVGTKVQGLTPIRRGLDEFNFEIPSDSREALTVRGTWLRVYDRVEGEIASCQIFGEFRVIETELADHLGVSRTVARDVLSRLNERGLLRKGATSHWLAGPMTARTLREKYELRSIMETAALRQAADYIDPVQIARVRDRIEAGESKGASELEEALMTHCLSRAPNAALVELIANNRLLLSAMDDALNNLGLPVDTVALDQYKTLFDLIGSRQIDASIEYLKEHLRILAYKSLARLKIVALVPESESIPRYLVPV
ncbi:Transcriptional regulator, GntR family [Sulfitobacter noctilucicola]|uniref:DNA-binding GntR family transcriptional regulator n=1 Tax=Sulfitobacter noctilucicola TaxID=1342301 RepID=A0A7W6M9N5_9RHOB|nr:GntR family transcriptional regulator [Sulfitobacter noctilucicola]KIN63547.1 Transcriptional regulator, GntR family [Sulfitobacter noctilucicola]MBB4174944.1 DNA-binding GntR family transcriptional regulator [Sulfitobacter noctilucicola]